MKKTLTQMVESRGLLVTELDGILDAPEAEGSLSADQQTRHDDLDTEIRSLDAEITAAQLASIAAISKRSSKHARVKQTLVTLYVMSILAAVKVNHATSRSLAWAAHFAWQAKAAA